MLGTDNRHYSKIFRMLSKPLGKCSNYNKSRNIHAAVLFKQSSQNGCVPNSGKRPLNRKISSFSAKNARFSMSPQKFSKVAVLYYNLYHSAGKNAQQENNNHKEQSSEPTFSYFCLSCSTGSWQIIRDLNISRGSIGTNTDLHATKHYSVAILPQAQV